MAPAIPTCPDSHTAPARLENATCQPCSSKLLKKIRQNSSHSGRLIFQKGHYTCFLQPVLRHLPLVICIVSLQPVWKNGTSNLVAVYLSPATCNLVLVTYRFVAVRLEDGISITGYDGMASAIPSCPAARTSNMRLENATCQPCYSATLNVCAPVLTK